MSSPDEIITKWIKKGNPRRIMDLSNWDLHILPDIPDEVEYLSLKGSTIIEINKLPKNLKWLNCSETSITKLPIPFPKDLIYIDCRYCPQLDPFDIPINIKVKSHFKEILDERERNNNNLSYFIDKYTNTKKYSEILDISSLNLIELPVLPDNLLKLNCSNNPIRYFTNLPLNIHKLICKDINRLTCNNIPNTLRYIDLSYSDVNNINDLPDSIHTIIVNNCKNLKRIDKLPLSLEKLIMTNSSIEYIDNIPLKLKSLDVSHTQMVYIPNLPDSLQQLHCDIIYKLEYITNLPPNLEYISLLPNIKTKIFHCPILNKLKYMKIYNKILLNNNTLDDTINYIKINNIDIDII